MELEDALEIADELVFLKAGRRLTPVELAIVKGACHRQTYEQIAHDASYSPNYLKFDVAPKLWKLLSDTFGETVGKTTLQATLERQWRKQQPSGIAKKTVSEAIENRAQKRPDLAIAPFSLMPDIDWGEAPDISIFYGRIPELETISQWIQRDRCHLIALLGMGGIGKTSLAAKLARDLQDQFEFVIWRSLRNAPPLESLLSEIVPFLSKQQDPQPNVERLLHWLRQSRCLIVLDNVETILQAGDRTGFYQPGYEAYGELFRLLGEAAHQSCILLTSREKPTEISTFETKEGKVRSLSLSGSWEASLALLESKELAGTAVQKRQLCEFYNCSPLALKIVAASIQSLFDGDIATFLAEETLVFNGLRRLLEQQFERLSPLEKTIMYWLAINREWTSTTELWEDIVPVVTRASLLEALESLVWRNMVETRSGKYTQQPVVMEYVTNDFIQRIVGELNTLNLDLFNCLALLKTTVLDYIRESQSRLILHPLCEQLKALFRNTEALKHHFQLLVQLMHETPVPFFAYGAGNCMNLLLHLGLDLAFYNFSEFKIRQVDFQSDRFSYLNITYADLKECRFTQTFGGILAVAFSPDDRMLALGDSNGTIRLWKTTTSSDRGLILDQPLIDLLGHTSWILSVAWHPDGHRLLSSSDDRTIKLWDVQTGECLSTFQGHQRSVWWAAWSPDGTQMASCSGDLTIAIWDVATGRRLKVWQGHQCLIYCVAWSPDGQTLASGSEDRTVRLWDVLSGECLKTLTVEGAWVRRVAWSPDGTMLASASSDLRLWDGKTGEHLRTLVGHSIWIDSIAWSPDSKTLASGSSDRSLKLWNPLTGDCLHTLQGHQDLIWALHWSTDGRTLASGSHDQTVRLWNAGMGRCRHVLQGYTNSIRSITWSPDSRSLASSSSDKTIRIWDVETGHCQKVLTGHQAWIYSVAWCPMPAPSVLKGGTQIIASSGADAAIKLWDVRTGDCLRTFYGHTSWVFSVAWSPDGQKLASGSSLNDLSARIWNPVTGECLKVLAGHQSWIWWVKWSPDGTFLATAADDCTIKLWDGQTGACLSTLYDDRQLGLAIGWSPDSQSLATSALENVVRIWNVATGAWEQELTGHQATIWAIAWSPKGQWLASSSDDGSIKLWNLETSQCFHTLWGHENRIWDLAWSPDGSILASSSLDATIRLWDVRNGTCCRILKSDRPYEGMNITGISGITEAQKTTLKALGAVEG